MKKLQKILIAVMLCVLSIIPVHADNTEWVKDDAGVLTQEEIDALNSQIQTITDTSKVGIYIRLKPDMDGSASIEDYAETIYTGEDLGIGNDHDGLLLVMSFDQRDYDLAAYGSRANDIFTDHAKDQIEDEMRPVSIVWCAAASCIIDCVGHCFPQQNKRHRRFRRCLCHRSSEPDKKAGYLHPYYPDCYTHSPQ